MELDKIICGDNVTVLRGLPDVCVDLTVTSPPYDDMDFEYNPISEAGLRDYRGYSWDFKGLVSELYRVTKPGGVVVWVVRDPTVNRSESLASSLQKIYFRRTGFNVHDTMIYEANGPAYPSKDKYYQVFEYMYVFSKGVPKTFNPIKDRENRWYGQKWSKGRTRRGNDGELKWQDWYKDEGEKLGVRFNVWKIYNGAGYTAEEDYAYDHPAMFPEKLARDHIASWSNAGDLILDPFVGSGTTAKEARKAGRSFIGIDISDEYCKIAEKRVRGANVPLFT